MEQGIARGVLVALLSWFWAVPAAAQQAPPVSANSAQPLPVQPPPSAQAYPPAPPAYPAAPANPPVPGYPATPGYPAPPGYPPGYGYPGYGYVPPPPASPAAPGVLEYHEGQAAPAGYHLVEKPRYDWTFGGLGFFGLSYGLALYVASLGDAIQTRGTASTDVLYIPVAGPLLGVREFNANSQGTFWLAVWSASQAAGIGAFIYGVTTPRRMFYRDDITGLNLRLSPFVASERPSLGLTLRGDL